MLGSLFGAAIRIVNIPVKLTESVADVVTGGDGSRRSKEAVSPVVPSEVLDKIAERLEE